MDLVRPFAGTLFRTYQGLEQVPELSPNAITRQARLGVDFCLSMMKLNNLQQYRTVRYLPLADGSYGALHITVLPGYGGQPMVSVSLEVSRRRVEEEEEEEFDSLYLLIPIQTFGWGEEECWGVNDFYWGCYFTGQFWMEKPAPKLTLWHGIHYEHVRKRVFSWDEFIGDIEKYSDTWRTLQRPVDGQGYEYDGPSSNYYWVNKPPDTLIVYVDTYPGNSTSGTLEVTSPEEEHIWYETIIECNWPYYQDISTIRHEYGIPRTNWTSPNYNWESSGYQPSATCDLKTGFYDCPEIENMLDIPQNAAFARDELLTYYSHLDPKTDFTKYKYAGIVNNGPDFPNPALLYATDPRAIRKRKSGEIYAPWLNLDWAATLPPLE